MPYIRKRFPYRQKPPSGVAPNLGHRQLRGIQHFWAYSGSGNDLVGTDNTTLDQGASWGVDGAAGRVVDLSGGGAPPDIIRGAHIAYKSEFTVCIRFLLRQHRNANDYLWNDGNIIVDENLNIYIANTPAFRIRIDDGANDPGALTTSQTPELNVWQTIILRRKTNYLSFTVNGDIANEWTSTATQSGPFQNSGTSPYTDRIIGTRGDSDATRDVNGLIDYCRVYSTYISDAQLLDIVNDPWAPFTRPLPIWIPSGAAPPAWNNTMNEISAPGAVNEITNANIQSVNEI